MNLVVVLASTADPCSAVFCPFWAQCTVSSTSAKPECRCPETPCSSAFAPVCGTDNITYSNECHLQVPICCAAHRILNSAPDNPNVHDHTRYVNTLLENTDVPQFLALRGRMRLTLDSSMVTCAILLSKLFTPTSPDPQLSLSSLPGSLIVYQLPPWLLQESRLGQMRGKTV